MTVFQSLLKCNHDKFFEKVTACLYLLKRKKFEKQKTEIILKSCKIDQHSSLKVLSFLLQNWFIKRSKINIWNIGQRGNIPTWFAIQILRWVQIDFFFFNIQIVSCTQTADFILGVVSVMYSEYKVLIDMETPKWHILRVMFFEYWVYFKSHLLYSSISIFCV